MHGNFFLLVHYPGGFGNLKFKYVGTSDKKIFLKQNDFFWMTIFDFSRRIGDRDPLNSACFILFGY